MITLRYIGYLLQKPLHSLVHKKCKRKADKTAADSKLYDKALAELVEYTKEPASAIEEKSRILPRQLNQQDFDRLSDKELKEFYSLDKHYLYELPLWNAATGRVYYFMEVVFPYLKRKSYSKVLDFGGGSGDLCIALSQYGFRAAYTDINRILSDFSRWRFEKRGLKIDIIETAQLSGRQFDCIVSFDVFEHLKNLPEKLKELSQSIKKGGSIVFNIEFSGEGLHLQENKVFSDLRLLDNALKNAGFAFDRKFKMFFFYKKI